MRNFYLLVAVAGLLQGCTSSTKHEDAHAAGAEHRQPASKGSLGWTLITAQCESKSLGSVKLFTGVRNDLGAVLSTDSTLNPSASTSGIDAVTFSDGAIDQSQGLTVTLKTAPTNYYPSLNGSAVLKMENMNATTGRLSARIAGSNSEKLNGFNESDMTCQIQSKPSPYL